MKTTIDLPDATLKQAKTLAAACGITFSRIVTEAIEEQLQRCSGRNRSGNEPPPWMAGFGALSHLGDEHHNVRRIIEEEFERLEHEDLA